MTIEALKKYYNVNHLENVSVLDGKIINWGDLNIPKPSQIIVDTAIEEYKKLHLKVLEIKDIAKEKISLFAPEYKQLNALRDGDADGIFPRIDAIRNYSNLLESKILNGEDVDINSGWSE